MKTKFNWNIIFLSTLLVCYSSLVSAQKFTIPVLPDTQESLTRNRGIFFSQIEWLTAKTDSLKTPMVLHVGDLVNFDNFDQWELASVGMRILDRANIPYAISLGNHDTGAVGMFSGSAAPGNVNVNLRNTQKFNYFFPVNRFPLQKGRFEKDKSDNSYYTFEAGNVKWIVVSLEFCAREEAAQWMDKVLKEHLNYNAIILTHYHLNPRGDINQNNAGYGDMKVIDIFEQYIKPNKNVLLVLSGHVPGSAWRIDQGPEGNNIYQVLQNFQHKDEGYLRLLEIDTEKGTISGSLYSPYLKKNRDDEKASFSFSDVKFIR